MQFIQNKFWLMLILALIAGILIPAPFQLDYTVIPAVMIILFLTYLKIDLIDIVSHIKNTGFLFYILCMFLFIIPAFIYGLFQIINPELAIGILLICSMPPGVASPVFTDIVKGNTSLSVVISILANILAPITILILFYVLIQKSIQLDLLGIFKSLVLVCFIPLIFAQIFRKINIKIITGTQKYYSVINILLIMFILYVIIAKQSNEILQNPLSILINIIWLYFVFFLLHLIGYVLAGWRNKKDKIAISVSKTYMNNALALGIAAVYFDPKIALLIAISEIPWATTLGLFKYTLKYIKDK